jgi:hypothetical protein
MGAKVALLARAVAAVLAALLAYVGVGARVVPVQAEVAASAAITT